MANELFGRHRAHHGSGTRRTEHDTRGVVGQMYQQDAQLTTIDICQYDGYMDAYANRSETHMELSEQKEQGNVPALSCTTAGVKMATVQYGPLDCLPPAARDRCTATGQVCNESRR